MQLCKYVPFDVRVRVHFPPAARQKFGARVHLDDSIKSILADKEVKNCEKDYKRARGV